MRKNISMIECFGIFSKVTAFDGIEWCFAVARTMLFPLHHKAGANALAEAKEREASRAAFPFPTSRWQITERRGLTPRSPNPDQPLAEFVDANRLFANVAFHQVRPRHCSVADAGKQTGSSYEPHVRCVSVSATDVRSPFTPRSGRTVRIVQAASPDPLLAPIETLFAELARRRLRSLTAERSPG
jgi:hypothetical protein